VQFQAPEKRRLATTYFVPEAGIGVAMQAHPQRQRGERLNVGIVGLGVGILATYAEPGDHFVFYEIDPKVKTIALEHFTFLDDAQRRGAKVEVRLGDARIVLEREAEQHAAAPYDLLVVDAFSSDAIPLHLLTAECFETYWRRVTPEGVLAVHVSNRHVDLNPVVRMHAQRAGREACFVAYRPSAEKMTNQAAMASNWILIAGNQAFLHHPTLVQARQPWPANSREPILWTDDFSNLFQVLK
jgi:spermidine synthase